MWQEMKRLSGTPSVGSEKNTKQVSEGTTLMVVMTACTALVQVVLVLFNMFLIKERSPFVLSVSLGICSLVFGVISVRFLRDKVPARGSIFISKQKYFVLKIIIVFLFLCWLFMQMILLLSVTIWGSALGFTDFAQVGFLVQTFMLIIGIAVSLFAYFKNP